jgi:hypothetical protein
MTKRVRLLTDRELGVIDDNRLHLALVNKCSQEVRRALDGLVEGSPDEESVTLDVVVSTLAGLLRLQKGVRGLVAEVVALGTSQLNEEELFAALASWIIDSQIGRGFVWDPTAVPQSLH